MKKWDEVLAVVEDRLDKLYTGNVSHQRGAMLGGVRTVRGDIQAALKVCAQQDALAAALKGLLGWVECHLGGCPRSTIGEAYDSAIAALAQVKEAK